MADRPLGYYFEDYELGQQLATRARTITESDIVAFAGLTGDYNPMHTDAEYMKSSPFGQRIAHGMLCLSYAVGQVYQLGFLEGRVIAFRGVEMKFSLPVFIGDTLHVEVEIKEKRDMPRLGGGMITAGIKIVNQAGQVVQSGDWSLLVVTRAAAAKAAGG
ncbi:MAG: MaoC/PaaZ C-terminal domain-containing protein [Chloroflexota bacterium]|nr:MaoC/PaaZ C-terminal domain-containing protein [Chloroflexota bacterium]